LPDPNADDLSQMDQATLFALAAACRQSLHAHVPIEAVSHRLRKDLRGDVKKALKKLRGRGLCQEHPAGGTMTWELSEAGLRLSQRLAIPRPGARLPVGTQIRPLESDEV
jgi:hypothetical protein